MSMSDDGMNLFLLDTFIENEPVWEEGLCSLEMLRGNDLGNMCNPEHKLGSWARFSRPGLT